jgi:hypothetical protein
MRYNPIVASISAFVTGPLTSGGSRKHVKNLALPGTPRRPASEDRILEGQHD